MNFNFEAAWLMFSVLVLLAWHGYLIIKISYHLVDNARHGVSPGRALFWTLIFFLSFSITMGIFMPVRP